MNCKHEQAIVSRRTYTTERYRVRHDARTERPLGGPTVVYGTRSIYEDLLSRTIEHERVEEMYCPQCGKRWMP